jgi:hypothetical protein
MVPQRNAWRLISNFRHQLLKNYDRVDMLLYKFVTIRLSIYVPHHSTMRGLTQHTLTGQHDHEQQTSYDVVRRDWAATCSSMTVPIPAVPQPHEAHPNTNGPASLPMGVCYHCTL